jgi:uncharacterized membrane protein YjfL (UPF0719 family)
MEPIKPDLSKRQENLSWLEVLFWPLVAGVILLLVYGLVKFVKWAWYN